MNQWSKPIIIFLAAAGFLGFIVMVSGIVPIGASSGHWPVTAWILEFSMERSFSTQSIGVKAPSHLEAPWMIQRGAVHYEIGCRQCHGMPGHPDNKLGQIMTPPAPFLPPEVPKWKPAELFGIVKHGVKFTGMPHWPDLKRDDEVWSMVAFLQKLPEMDEETYKKIVYGETGPFTLSTFRGMRLTEMILQTCAHCHGEEGNGRGTAAFPKLAGQNAEYLARALREYKSGIRHSGTMKLVASSLEEEMIIELSRHYHEKKRIKPSPTTQSDRAAELEQSILRGKVIAYEGIPEMRVAACISCHGPKAEGKEINPQYPELRGQFAEYLQVQLRLFQEEKRGDGKYVKIMKKALGRHLTEQQIWDVSRYYESLTPSAP